MSNNGRELRVGLIGPCPPPHGGVTRVVQNHLRCWRDQSPQVWLMSVDRPDKAEPYPEVTWVDGPGANLALSIGMRGPFSTDVLHDLAPRTAQVVADVLAEGRRRAAATAEATMAEVREGMGL